MLRTGNTHLDIKLALKIAPLYPENIGLTTAYNEDTGKYTVFIHRMSGPVMLSLLAVLEDLDNDEPKAINKVVKALARSQKDMKVMSN